MQNSINKAVIIYEIVYAFGTFIGPDFVRDRLRNFVLSFLSNLVGSWISTLTQTLSGIS